MHPDDALKEMGKRNERAVAASGHTPSPEPSTLNLERLAAPYIARRVTSATPFQSAL